MKWIFILGLILFSPFCISKEPVSAEEVLRTLKAIQSKLKEHSHNSHRAANSYNNQTTAQAPQLSEQRIAVGEFLLFSLYLNEHYLGEIYAIKAEHGVLLGLSGLVASLQLAIEVDTEFGIASGWFVEKNQRFEFDATGLFQAGEQHWQLEPQQFLIDDDVYIDDSVLAQALAISIVPQYDNLELALFTDQVFPVIAQMQRQARKVNQVARANQATLPWKSSPYQAMSSPVADLQLNYEQDQRGNGASYSLLGTQDFAYLSTEYFLSGRETDLLTNSRLTFSRQDVNNQLLGFMAASEVEFGDVTATQVGSRYNSEYGRGVKVSNYQLDQTIDNNRVTLTGAIQPGWDVELYRNGLLIEQQLSLSDGRYVFADVDLLFGENNFELIFYGPQGQVERKTEYYYIDGTQLEKGEGAYEFSVSEQGKQLLGNDGFSADQGWLAAGRYQFGLTDNIALYTGAMAQKRDTDELYHVSLGSNISVLERLLLNLEYEQNNQQQTELEFTARTRVAEQSLSFSATNRTDQQLGDKQDYNSYQFDMSGEVMKNNYGRINYQNNFLLRKSQGIDLKQAYNRLNYSYANFSINNLLQWQNVNEQESVYGATRLQGRIGRTYSRFGVDYRLSPVNEIESYEAEFSRNLTAKLQAELTLRNRLDNDIQSAEVGMNWQNKRLNLGSNFNYNSNDDWQLRVYSRFSFGFDPEYFRPFMTNRSLTSTGSLMVKVFLDSNNNGVMDNDEQGVAGVKVKGVQNYRQAITDADGVALLTSMPANRTTDIILDKNSFPDPFLIAAHDGFSITPRAGFVEYMDYPLNNASEIEGVVYNQTEDGSVVQPYAKLALLDKQGNKVAQTQAAFDGYYLFTDLRPGEYKAVIDKQYQQQKSLKSKQTHTVNLSAKGDVLVGVDLTLSPLEKRSGFIANAGQFGSLNILKVYFALLKKRLHQLGVQQVFYVKGEQGYTLALGYDENAETELETLCEKLQKKALRCHVMRQDIHY